MVGRVQAGQHSTGLGGRQQLHQPSRVTVLDLAFIHAAYLHAMGNARLCQQSTSSRRRGGEEKHRITADQNPP